MTDWLSDTPIVTRSWCPVCEPEGDPIAEMLEVRWCDPHHPSREGKDDEKVTVQGYMSGSAEVGGDDNRRWCELIHGRVALES